MAEQVVTIDGFDPLKVSIPRAERFAGVVRIQLPPVHLVIYDLSLGGILDGAPHIGADARVTDLVLTLGEPGITGAQLFDLIYAAQDRFRDIWQAMQRAMDERGALL